MGWNSTTKIMTAPLNINDGGDIQAALNMSPGDLGYCIANATNVNKWAKWKPERSPKIAPLTLDDRKENNFGLNLTRFTDISSLRSGYGGQWEYLAPRGLSYGERFRMYDFLNPTIASSGYNGQAKCFFRRSVSTFPTSYVIGTGGLSFIAQWEPESQLESSYPGSVKRSEIRVTPANELSTTLADAYFGVIMYHANWSGIKIKTASTAVGANSYTSTVSFSDSELQNFPGGVSIYPILSVSPVTAISTTFPSDGVFALPMSPFTLDVASADTAVQIVPMGTGGSGTSPEAVYTMRGRIEMTGKIGMATNGTINSITGVSYDVYKATSDSDISGTQIGGTQTYQTPLTPSTTLDMNFQAITEYCDYLRVVITGYAGQTLISRTFFVGVQNQGTEMPLIN